MSSGTLLELIGITKIYPGVTALDDISLRVERGEVLGLIGENGAGKSTLMKILGGVVAPTAGVIRIDGVDHAAFGVKASMRAGIAFVHQELNLFENLDVAANVFIGREPRRSADLVDRRALRDRVAPLLARLGADFGPDTPVEGLSIAQRQLVEIAKALSIDARVIIMDEPTSSLTLRKPNGCCRSSASCGREGVSIIYISHRLGEVKACADRVICLRDGRTVGELARAEIDHAAMIRLMIGRDLKALYIPPDAARCEGRLRSRRCRYGGISQRQVDLSVGKGEISGWPAWSGQGGRRWRVRCSGSIGCWAGEIWLDGAAVEIASPRQAIELGDLPGPRGS